MRKRIGIGCIILGLICLMVAIGFVFYNRYEANNGAHTSQSLLEHAQSVIFEAAEPEITPPESTPDVSVTEQIPESAPREMLTVPAGDYDCIGILSIPVLKLELPVLANWDYEKLKSAPCHYYGSCYASDFVIAGHNYPAHFGRLSQLRTGDLVVFTDVTGTVHCYEVILLETLAPTATEEMITSGFDLSLYTCTPGGGNRVTVRCRTAKP
jgi:sortase A